MRRGTNRPVLLALAMWLLAGCGILEPSAETELTLHVAPYTVDCVGSYPQQCLLVKEQLDEEWSYFYDPIGGFVHEPGFTYELRVARRRVPDPPADASAFAYRLRRVVARTPAPGPAGG